MSGINKLRGLYLLRQWGLPAIKWEIFTRDTTLPANCLWTVRTALYSGQDVNLPRAVGVEAKEAEAFARRLLQELGDRGVVFYYPYFVAERSGTLLVGKERAVVEAVKGDLWHLVSEGKRDAYLLLDLEEGKIREERPPEFFTPEEQKKLLGWARQVRWRGRDYLSAGFSLLLEWSVVAESEERSGGDKFVFYELRTVTG